MANTVQIRNSSTAAAEPSSLEAGELAINTADAKLFWEDSAGSIQTTYLQPNLGDLADVSDTVPSPNTSVYVLANVPGVGWSSQGAVGSVSVGSQPIGGWPSGSVGASLDGKASTSHASTHATGGSDAIAPSDIGAAPAASPTFTGVITVSAGSASAPAIVASGDSNTGLLFPAADTVAVSTAGVERVRVSSGGRLLIGNSSGRNLGGFTPSLIEGTNANGSRLALCQNTNNSAGSAINLCKSRGTAVGSVDVLQDGDLCGSIFFNAADGTDLVSVAGSIACEIDGTPGSNDVPGALVFSTTADGASTPTERARIKPTGSVRFVPLAADPASGNEAGDVYYNSTTNKLRVYNGTSWVDLH